MSHKIAYDRVTELDCLAHDSGYYQDRTPWKSSSPYASPNDTRYQGLSNEYNSRTLQQYLGGPVPQNISVGIPGRKPYFETMDLLSLLLVFAYLAVAICIITIKLTLAWHLGYTLQLIVIGFLLSIMNLALNRSLTALFFMIEVRFGSSTLQNYEALLRKQPLATTRISTMWRIIMTLFVALPLGLSAGYKRYFGGTTSAVIPTGDIPFHMYGTTALPGLNRLGDSAGMAILINSTMPFLQQSNNDTALPANFSAVYGQNVYMISNTSAAMLDLPMPELVTSIQQSLGGTNKKTLSAKVHGFVATYNVSTEQDRDIPGYWDEYYNQPYAGVREVSLFTGYYVYTYMNWFGDDGSWMYVAMCADGDFNNTALRFDTYRHLCDATWDITSQSMNLIHASCNKDPLSDQRVLTN